MIVYLAGPIAGVKEYWKQFNNVAADLARHGHAVLNPASLPAGLAPDAYMPICLAMIQACDEVLLLPGWRESEGVKLEINYARYQGKAVSIFEQS